MKFSEMDKNQKQLLILSVGGVITAFFIVQNLLLKPAKEAALEAQTTIEELESEVNKGDLLLKRDTTLRKEMGNMAAEIQELRAQNLPPETSRYIWALQHISSLARGVGIKADVQETPGVRYMPSNAGKNTNRESVPMWVPYSVNVTMYTSFENLKKFLQELRVAHPFVSVGSVQIEPNDVTPEIHYIRLTLEWPVLRFEEDLEWLKSLHKEAT